MDTSNMTSIYVAAGAGGAVLLLVAVIGGVLYRRRRSRKPSELLLMDDYGEHVKMGDIGTDDLTVENPMYERYVPLG
ncbi:Hypp7025 [Branchiostoma lanceolatum]|uniref:Hypp7025 protein n=1 Tax=Branchiostoma lanceolatum TaxID=7740 RepID=A0A8J9YWQ1_BRALA|nr:Hypp7025 [Branchiostoma lanceolatum]